MGRNVCVNAAVFDQFCVVPSQRHTASFVWDAMARGAFEFPAIYLRLVPDGCAVSKTD
jgi:hypothetical protein